MSGEDGNPLPSVFDEVNTGILLHDPETGEIVDANRAMAAMYGYSVERFRELDVIDFSATTSRYSQAEAERLIRDAASGEVEPFDWHIKHANGELLWTEVDLSRVSFDGETYVMAEVHDITEQKRQERRLHLVNRILRHNLRNDMTVVMGNAQLLREAVNDDTLAERADVIMDIASDLGELSDDIGHIERIVSQDVRQGTTTDVAEVVQAVTASVRERHPEVELRVTVETTAEIHANENLEYALEHALRNAADHNDAADPQVDVTVDEYSDGRVVIAIADNGPTIPPMEIEALDHAVESDETHHGTGVGLWLMDWCVESLGGELVFEENEPRGNVVRFLLPTQSP